MSKKLKKIKLKDNLILTPQGVALTMLIGKNMKKNNVLKKAYIVLAECNGEITYGVDRHIWLCGIYLNEDEAVKRVETLTKRFNYIKELKEQYNKYGFETLEKEMAFYAMANQKLGITFNDYPDIIDITFRIEERYYGDINDCYLGGATYIE